MSKLKTVTGFIKSAEDLTNLSGLLSFSGEDELGFYSYPAELNSYIAEEVEFDYPTQSGYDYSYRITNRVYNVRESWINNLNIDIDWDLVPVDTPVKVRNSELDSWENALFAKYDPLDSKFEDLSSSLEFYTDAIFIGFRLKVTPEVGETSMFELIDGGIDQSPDANLLHTVGISSGFYVGESTLPAETGSGVEDLSSGFSWSNTPNYFAVKYLNNLYEIEVNLNASTLDEVVSVINHAFSEANDGDDDLTPFVECYKVNSIGLRTLIAGEFSSISLNDSGNLLTTLGLDPGIVTAEGSPLDVIDTGVGTSDFTSGYSWSTTEGEFFEITFGSTVYKVTVQGPATTEVETVNLLNASLVYTEYAYDISYFVWNDGRSSDTVSDPNTDFTGYRFADLK